MGPPNPHQPPPPTSRTLRIRSPHATWKLRKPASQPDSPPLSVSIKREMIRFKIRQKANGDHSEGAGDFAKRLTEHLIHRLPSVRITYPLVTKWIRKYHWIQAINGVPPGKNGASLVTQVQAEFSPQSISPEGFPPPAPPSISPEGSPPPAPPSISPEGSPPPAPPSISPEGSPPAAPQSISPEGSPPPAPPSPATKKRHKMSKKSLHLRVSNTESILGTTLHLLKRLYELNANQLGGRILPTLPDSPSNIQNIGDTGDSVEHEINAAINQIQTQENQLSRRQRVTGRQHRRLFKVEPNHEVQIIYESYQYMSAEMQTPSSISNASAPSTSTTVNSEPSTSTACNPGPSTSTAAAPNASNNGIDVDLSDIIRHLVQSCFDENQSRQSNESEEER